MTLLALVEVTKNGFLKSATIWSLNKDEKNDTQLILNSSFFLNMIITSVYIVVILVAAAILHYAETYELLVRLLQFYCIQLLLYIPFSHFEYVFTSQVRFRQLMFAYLIRNFTFFLFLITIFSFSITTIKLEYLVLFQSVGIILSTLFMSRYYEYTFSLRNAPKEYWKQIINFGKYVFATNASSMLFRSTDHYMLAGLINATSVAYYNVALRITNLMDLPSTAVAEVLFPMSVKTSNKAELKTIYEKAVGYIVAFAFPASLGIFLLAEPIVVFIAGRDYLVSAVVLQVTLIYGLILPFLKQFGTVIDALNRPKINFYLMFSTFMINIICNYLCINKFGLLGAAYGTLITYVISLVASQLILRKFLGTEFFKVFVYMIEAYRELYRRLIKSSSNPE